MAGAPSHWKGGAYYGPNAAVVARTFPGAETETVWGENGKQLVVRSVSRQLKEVEYDVAGQDAIRGRQWLATVELRPIQAASDKQAAYATDVRASRLKELASLRSQVRREGGNDPRVSEITALIDKAVTNRDARFWLDNKSAPSLVRASR